MPHYRLFPFHKVQRDSKVVIYGMGEIGQWYLAQLQAIRYAEIVAITAADWDECTCLSVCAVPPDALRRLNFDYVIICLEEPNEAETVRKKLCEHLGVESSKIIQADMVSHTFTYRRQYIEKVAVVIPIYKRKLSPFEQVSLNRCYEILGKHLLIFFAPESLPVPEYIKGGDNVRIERFPDKFFRGRNGYNELLMSEAFYQRFLAYEYILIYQLDAFVFYDGLELFCDLGYDYIGAPWLLPSGIFRFRNKWHTAHVGNGGISLRKTKSCFELIKNKREVLADWEDNEDAFFAYCGKYRLHNFRTAPRHVAYKFAFEHPVNRSFARNGDILPFACHQANRYGGKAYTERLCNMEGDVSGFANCLADMDFNDEQRLMQSFLLKRLHRQSSLLSLLDKNAFSKKNLLVIGNMLGKRLCHEIEKQEVQFKFLDADDNELLSTVFDYIEKKEFLIILAGLDIPEGIEDTWMRRWQDSQLVMKIFDAERKLMKQFEAHGLSYGAEYISLGREYAKKQKIWCPGEHFIYGKSVSGEAGYDCQGGMYVV